MNTKILFSVVMLTLVTVLASNAQVTNEFTASVGGWRVVGLRHQGPYEPPLANHPIVFHSSGGNPAGYVSFSDTFSSDVAFFDAPAEFLGDQAVMYGGTLSFDFAVGPGVDYRDADVVLVGAGMVFVSDLARRSSSTWTNYSIHLAETAGWRLGSLTGQPPTKVQFQAALSSILALRIRADDNSDDGDTTGLDNVRMRPAEPTLKIRVSEVEICWDALSNVTYRVDYRSDLTTNQWQTLFDCVRGEGAPKQMYDRVPVGQPQRFYQIAVTNCVPQL